MQQASKVSIATGGLCLSTIGVLANSISQWVNTQGFGNTLITMGIGIIAIGIYLRHDSKYEKLFKMCGLKNAAEQLPVIIKKTHKGKETTLVIRLPAGLSQKHFEQKHQELEQYLNAKIKFSFNKNLIIDSTEMILKTKYPFLFEACEKPLAVYCGESDYGKFVLDIEKCPHAIVAGETGGGKTSLLDIIVLSLIMNKFNVDLHLIDFQCVGLGKYENCKKVKSYGETITDFKRLMDEMEEENTRRLKLFRRVKNKVYIDKLSIWNKCFPEQAMPYKVIIIDEFTKLAENEELLEGFRNRVSMDRKVGIHYIVSLQRPDVKMIEGSIKANMPTRIAFKTVTDVDSRVIIDIEGAEKLKNPGRFLIKYCGELTEVQSMFIDCEDVGKFLKQNKLLKSKEEIQAERYLEMKKLRSTCINPYLKGGCK